MSASSHLKRLELRAVSNPIQTRSETSIEAKLSAAGKTPYGARRALARRGSTPGLAPTSGEVVRLIQSDSLRTDSPVRNPKCPASQSRFGARMPFVSSPKNLRIVPRPSGCPQRMVGMSNTRSNNKLCGFVGIFCRFPKRDAASKFPGPLLLPVHFYTTPTRRGKVRGPTRTKCS